MGACVHGGVVLLRAVCAGQVKFGTQTVRGGVRRVCGCMLVPCPQPAPVPEAAPVCACQAVCVCLCVCAVPMLDAPTRTQYLSTLTDAFGSRRAHMARELALNRQQSAFHQIMVALAPRPTDVLCVGAAFLGCSARKGNRHTPMLRAMLAYFCRFRRVVFLVSACSCVCARAG